MIIYALVLLLDLERAVYDAAIARAALTDSDDTPSPQTGLFAD